MQAGTDTGKSTTRCIAFRAAVVLLVTGGMLLALLGFIAQKRFEREFNHSLEEKLAGPALLLSQKAIEPHQSVKPELLSKIVHAPVREAFLIMPNGTIRVAMNPAMEGGHYRDYLKPQESALPFQSFGTPAIVRYRDAGGKHFISILAAVRHDDRFFGNLFFRISSDDLSAKKRKITGSFIIGCLIMLLLSAGTTACYLYLTIVSRISRAVRALQSIESDHRSIRPAIPTGPSDQLGMFIKRVNSTLSTIAENSNDLRKLNSAGEKLSHAETRKALYTTATNILCGFFSVQHGELNRLTEEDVNVLDIEAPVIGSISSTRDHRRLLLSLPHPEQRGASLLVVFYREDGKPIEKAENTLYLNQLSGIITNAADRILDFEEIACAEEKYRELFSSAVEGIFRTIPSGKFEVINPALAAMSGYSSPDEMISAVGDIEKDYYVNPDDRKKIFEILFREGKVVDQETFFRRKDGSVFPAAVSCHLVLDEQGDTIALEGRIVNIEERKLREREEQNRKAAEAASRVQLKMVAKLEENEQTLQQSLKEKEILLREIYHRTKNNMLVIISILKLQLSKVDDPKSLEIFKETENRIRAMSMVHEKLYQSASLVRIDLGSYIDELATSLVRTMVVDRRIQVETEMVHVPISIDHAVPFGLAVNEIITNSLKHGFAGRTEGKIRLALTLDADHVIRLQIWDDGVGFPDTFATDTGASFGIQITRNLVTKQLNGAIAMENDNGAKTTISFTEPDRKQRIPLQ